MEISKILNRITKSKRSQAKLVNYVIAQDQILGNKLRYCGSWLLFREWTESNEARLLNANFCKKSMLCEACAVRRSGKMNAAYLPKIESVAADNPKLIPAMVTITVKNGRDLAERIHHLKDTWKKMGSAKRRGSSSSDRNKNVEWNKVLGSLKAMEITINKKGEWHPHYHIFVLLSDYIDQKKLSAEWQHWSGDSKIVGVTKCYGGIRAGLVEVLKYACKFSSMTPAQTLHTHECCTGHRMMDPQGILRGVPEPDIDHDDIEGMSGPYRDFIAQWLAGSERYRIDEVSELLDEVREDRRKAKELKKKSK